MDLPMNYISESKDVADRKMMRNHGSLAVVSPNFAGP